MRRTSFIAVVLAALAASALLVPAGAVAKDADVIAAYRAHKPALDRAVDRYEHAARRASRTGSRRWLRRTIRADRHMNGVLGRIVAAVARTKPSSDTGAKARRCTIAAHRYWRKANRAEIASIRAYLSGHRKRSDRLIARANRVMRHRTFPNDRCRKRAFRAIARRRTHHERDAVRVPRGHAEDP